jgi:hypothetical protein
VERTIIDVLNPATRGAMNDRALQHSLELNEIHLSYSRLESLTSRFGKRCESVRAGAYTPDPTPIWIETTAIRLRGRHLRKPFSAMEKHQERRGMLMRQSFTGRG